MYKELIKTALKTQDLTWFTSPLNGSIKRYIVALTHNTANTSIQKLNRQAIYINAKYSNVNIWGWKDTATNELFIDVSTSFDSLNDALALAKEYDQIAIFDMQELKEIRLK